jgi:hypothetical protein
MNIVAGIGIVIAILALAILIWSSGGIMSEGNMGLEEFMFLPLGGVCVCVSIWSGTSFAKHHDLPVLAIASLVLSLGAAAFAFVAYVDYKD